MNMPIEKKKFNTWPAIIASILLFLAVFPWPYGYYTFLRVVITGMAIYYAYWLYQVRQKGFYFWSLIAIIVLFNPIIPVYLISKLLWGIVDVIVAGFFIGLIVKFKKK